MLQRQVGAVRAVDDVTFDVKRGETLGLVGESGCGKSTTAARSCSCYKPTAGQSASRATTSPQVAAASCAGCAGDMQMIFQDPYASLNPRMTVGRDRGRAAGDPRPRQRQANAGSGSTSCCELVGLDPDHGDRYPHEFSGGQRQRIGIARALALNPDFIVCDEPISALDVASRRRSSTCSRTCRSSLGLTYLFIAHDLAVVRHISDRVAVMYLGKIVEITTATSLYDSPLHPYTLALLSAVPIPDPACRAQAAPHHPDRRRAVAREPAAGLPVPHALPVRPAAAQEIQPPLIEVEGAIRRVPLLGFHPGGGRGALAAGDVRDGCRGPSVAIPRRGRRAGAAGSTRRPRSPRRGPLTDPIIDATPLPGEPGARDRDGLSSAIDLPHQPEWPPHPGW